MTFGQWKAMFRCCNKENMLKYQPKKAKKIILASIILYNFKKLNGYI